MGEPLPVDARFAFLVILSAFSVMEDSTYQDANIDAWEIHRRVENHPRRADFLRWTAEDVFFDANATRALARELVVDVTVDRRGTIESAGETYETATISVRVRDPELLYHCLNGFNWATAMD